MLVYGRVPPAGGQLTTMQVTAKMRAVRALT